MTNMESKNDAFISLTQSKQGEETSEEGFENPMVPNPLDQHRPITSKWES